MCSRTRSLISSLVRCCCSGVELLGTFQRQQADQQHRIEDRRVTYADPLEIANDTVLTVPVVSDAIGRLNDCPLVIGGNALGVPRLRPPRFSWPGLKLSGRK